MAYHSATKQLNMIVITWGEFFAKWLSSVFSTETKFGRTQRWFRGENSHDKMAGNRGSRLQL